MARPFSILSIDGGGIRGIIPAQILVRIEELLGRRIGEVFDFVAGTSTGGILACGLLTPSNWREINASPEVQPSKETAYSARELVELYVTYGSTIFDSGFFASMGLPFSTPRYASSGLETVFDRYFGTTRLSHLVKPCLITAYDITRRKAQFFRQHTAKIDIYSDYLLRHVLLATTAAPTYFAPAIIESMRQIECPMIDGGVFANNPAMCAWAEAFNRLDGNPSDIILLSLGTGFNVRSYRATEAGGWYTYQWVEPLLDMMFDGIAQTVDFQLRQVFSSLSRADCYLRVDHKFNNHNLEPTAAMDDASKENIAKLIKLGDEIFGTYSKQLDKFVEVLRPN